MSSFVIARDSNSKEFYTSTSAYDRPEWVPLTEATVYKTESDVTRAQQFLQKRAAAWSAVVLPLNELAKGSINSKGVDAKSQVADTAGEDNDEEAAKERRNPLKTAKKSKKVVENFLSRVKKPGNPVADQTESSYPEVEKIKYEDPAIIQMGELKGKDVGKSVVPAAIKDPLVKLSKEFASKVDSGVYDTETSSMYLTIQAAMEQIVEYLDGTTSGLKKAQVLFSSLMGPIQFEFPEKIRKYLLSGGETPSIKDMMSDIKQDKEKVKESTEVCPECGKEECCCKDITDYDEWVKECKRCGDNVQISGDEQGAEAINWSVKGNDTVGTWTGKKGTIVATGTQKLKEGSAQTAKAKVKNYVNKQISQKGKQAKEADATGKKKTASSYSDEAKFHLKQKRALKSKTAVGNFGTLEYGRKTAQIREFVDVDGTYADAAEAQQDLASLKQEYQKAKAADASADTIAAIQREYKRISAIISSMTK